MSPDTACKERSGERLGTPRRDEFAKVGARRTKGSAAHSFRGSKSKVGPLSWAIKISCVRDRHWNGRDRRSQAGGVSPRARPAGHTAILISATTCIDIGHILNDGFSCPFSVGDGTWLLGAGEVLKEVRLRPVDPSKVFSWLRGLAASHKTNSRFHGGAESAHARWAEPRGSGRNSLCGYDPVRPG